MSTRKRNRNVWQGIALAATLLVTTLSQAAGLLQPSDGSLPPLEIKAHQVEVVIEDGYAITTVEQLFHNPHNRDLAARYSFPVPEHGSVAEFTLWIDGKPVTCEGTGTPAGPAGLRGGEGGRPGRWYHREGELQDL